MLNNSFIQDIAALPPEEGLAKLAQVFPGQVVFSTSLGQEDQVITDMIFRNNFPVQVFTLDTGRLFNETYELLEKTNARYKTSVRIYFPDTAAVEEYVAAKGINGFYESVENRKSCCHIRKVEPLNRALAGAKVWVTGLRAGQSANRKVMPALEWDEGRGLYKYNPLIKWSYEEMMEYIHRYDIPYNRLHEEGFLSIGCAPCTRAIAPGEDARAGRWWWEQTQKECGLHSTGAVKSV